MNYLIISVLLLINTYILMPWSALCGLIWLIPLIIPTISGGKSWNFKDGALWGVLVFSFHLSWLMAMLLNAGGGIKGILIWVLTIGWFAFACGIWLWATRYSWIFSSIIFFLFLTRWCLLPFGVLEGYPLINPLLCLAMIPESLWITQWIGEVATFGLIVVFCILLSYALVFKRISYGLLALFCLLPFFAGVLVYEKKETSKDGMAYVQPWWHGCKSPMFAGYRMIHDLCEIRSHNCNLRTIIMPESTFCFDVDEYKHFIPLWCNDMDGITILFGGHRRIDKDCDVFINSVFVLRNGLTQQIYDKQHYMPFIERVSYVFTLLGLGSLFIKSEYAKLQGNWFCHNNDCICLNGQMYQIFICSELFFHAKHIKKYPILLLWNDSWLSFNWVKSLALLYIDYVSVVYDIAILHASTQGRTNII